ncbi:MAG: hypothetical protein QM723_40680 [Myxococcaceae bacterium]
MKIASQKSFTIGAEVYALCRLVDGKRVAKAGAVGRIVDIDNRWVTVAFSQGAFSCARSEIATRAEMEQAIATVRAS